jgi:peptide/nickel transport system substrate-binding protein
MRQKGRLAALISVLAAITLVAAACGSNAASHQPKANVLSTHKVMKNSGEKDLLPKPGPNKPIRGGTLRIVGQGDVDHLDTCCAYYTTTYELLRAVTRQLVSYQSSDAHPAPTKIVPDLATWKVSKNGLVYTFHIKKGVYWDLGKKKAQVTAEDEIVGLKRLCNPVAPAGPLQYWTANISGFAKFCSGFQALKTGSTAASEVKAIKTYIDKHNVSGLKAVNSLELKITLDHPAADLLYILAMPFSSPVPATQILKYVPSSAQEAQNFISDGPYTIKSYTPNSGFTLVPNPYWSQKTDTLRHQYMKKIIITEGQNPSTIQQQLETGTADLEWDTLVPSADVQSAARNRKQFVAAFFGGSTYLVFNMSSKTDHGALKKVSVRKALQYCVNKRHLIQVSGGPLINAAATEILAPQISGYAGINPYKTPNLDAGDPGKCKSMLKKAGYKKGLTLTLAYDGDPPMPAQAQALQSDFQKAGVKLKLFNVNPSQGAYFDYIAAVKNRPHWDLAFGAWFPDWDGTGGAQSFFGPLLDGAIAKGEAITYDYGGYNDTHVNKAINAALKVGSIKTANKDWGDIDRYVMEKDPAWVPLLWQALPQFIGKRVRHAEFNGFLGYVDITNLWVTKK